ncbi:hypothetical protein K474DRAFT_1666999 [Panus rudis PR-1116 ss-1]|nr:hypothetical protein K474DRAFT_1666999 [Panus rudis PR-1116 ss-1]
MSLQLLTETDVIRLCGGNRTQLLNVRLEQRKEGTGSEDTSSTEEHPDERQIRLDTDRSFVLYPVGETRLPHRPSDLLLTIALCRRWAERERSASEQAT